MSFEDFRKRFTATFGESDADDVVRYYIDTGYPPLNRILSGHPDHGLPGGRIIEIHGGSSCGKTWLTCQIMMATQRQGGISIFADQERSLDVNLARRNGLSTDFPYWVYVREETWEDYCDKVLGMCQMIRKEKIIGDDKPIMVVFDSIAAMVPKSSLYDSKGNRREIKDLNMNDTTALPRAASNTMKILNSEFSRLNVTFVLINQIREKPGVVYGNPQYTPGGKAFEFYPSIRLQLGRKMVKDKEGLVTGQIIGAQTVKSKKTRPFQEVEMLLVFPEEGGAVFDRETGLINELIGCGKLQYSKPRVTWTDGKQYFVKALSEKIKSEGLYDELVDLYREAHTRKLIAEVAPAT